MTRSEQPTVDNLDEWTDALDRALREGASERAISLVEQLHPAVLADVMEALPRDQRPRLWQCISDPAVRGELLIEARGEVRDDLIDTLPTDELTDAVTQLQLDELADLYERLPRNVLDAVVRDMDGRRRERLARVLSWPHDTAGGLMDADALAVREDITLRMAQRYLRYVRQREGRLPEHTTELVVIDRGEHLLGVLPLADLASLPPETRVSEAMNSRYEPLTVDLAASRVARLFEDRDLVAAPVVDDRGRLLGRITVDDVVDVIRDESERSLMQPAGLDHEADMFAPVLRKARGRGAWLMVHMVNAFIASWVIGQFQASIEQRVALAVLMPIVASMGGVAGIQTLTVVTRGLALNQVGRANGLRLLGHELAVILVGGLGLALILGAVVLSWFSDPALASIVAAALLINLINGALCGTLIPMVLERLGVDPAVAGGVALTSLTDILGFAAFLGLATLLLL